MKMNGLMKYMLAGVTSLALSSTEASSSTINLFAGFSAGGIFGWSDLGMNDKTIGNVDLDTTDIDDNFETASGTYKRSSDTSFTSHGLSIGGELMLMLDDAIPYFSVGVRVGVGYTFGGLFGASPLGSTDAPAKPTDGSPGRGALSASGGLKGFYIEPQVMIGADIMEIHTLLCFGWFFSQHNYEINLKYPEGQSGSVNFKPSANWVHGLSVGAIFTFPVGPCAAGGLRVQYKRPGITNDGAGADAAGVANTKYAYTANVLDVAASVLVEVPVN